MQILCDIRKLRTLNHYVDSRHFATMYFEDEHDFDYMIELFDVFMFGPRSKVFIHCVTYDLMMIQCVSILC